MAIVTVHALSTGTLTLPERLFITPADPEASRTVPSLSFLVQHQTPSKTTRLVFDLGLRRDVSLYPESLQKHCANRQPMTTMPDAVASLAKGGLSVHDIDYILFSHVHYDHIGLPSDFSDPKTKFIVGPGSLDLIDGKTKLDIGSHSFFEPGIMPEGRTFELPPTGDDSTAESSSSGSTSNHPTLPPHEGLNQTWKPLHPFPHAIDLFSDGTVYVLSAPGHLPGHVNLLCRTGPRNFALLAGDACHDVRLFTGERDVATWTDDEGRHCCIHADVPRAKETIRRLAEASKEGVVVEDGLKADVEVVFAHNWQWELDAVRRGRFWPGKL